MWLSPVPLQVLDDSIAGFLQLLGLGIAPEYPPNALPGSECLERDSGRHSFECTLLSLYSPMDRYDDLGVNPILESVVGHREDRHHGGGDQNQYDECFHDILH